MAPMVIEEMNGGGRWEIRLHICLGLALVRAGKTRTKAFDFHVPDVWGRLRIQGHALRHVDAFVKQIGPRFRFHEQAGHFVSDYWDRVQTHFWTAKT
jgi:hypothetical protein